MESTNSQCPVIGTLQLLENCREFGLDLDGDRWCQELKTEIQKRPPSGRLNTQARGKSLGSQRATITVQWDTRRAYSQDCGEYKVR